MLLYTRFYSVGHKLDKIIRKCNPCHCCLFWFRVEFICSVNTGNLHSVDSPGILFYYGLIYSISCPRFVIGSEHTSSIPVCVNNLFC